MGGKATKSAVQRAEKKLERNGIISILPNKKVIVEIYGLVNEIKRSFEDVETNSK